MMKEGLFGHYSFSNKTTLMVFVLMTSLPEGICVTLNLCIQALKLYIYYYLDNYLKDVISVLPCGA